MNVQSGTEDEIVDAGQTLSDEFESSVEETKKLEKANLSIKLKGSKPILSRCIVHCPEAKKLLDVHLGEASNGNGT